MYERLKNVFATIGCDYQIIFVNDGSPDNSEVVLREIAEKDSRVIVITHTRNFSSQNAFMSGMRVSTGDAVVLLDGDLQDPPEIIPEFFTKWQEGFEVVYGVRTKREAPLFLRIMYPLFYRIFSKLSYVRIPHDAGDFSLMDRKVVDVIIEMPERDLLIRGLRAWVGFRQTGVPYYRPERMFGRTTNNFLKNVRWAKKAIFSFSYEPLEMLFYAAISISGITFFAILFYLGAYIIYPDQPRGSTTIILLILFFGSVQLISISIIGEYLGRIFEEVKQRPTYIIKEILNKPQKKSTSKERSIAK